MSNPRTSSVPDERPDATNDAAPERTHPSGPLDGTQNSSEAHFQRAEKAPPPKVIAHYELHEKLGEGGMGAVYKGWHPKMQRFGAVKLLPAELMQNPALLARFDHEIALAAQLDHPHVVRTFDAGEEAGVHYLVLEYLEGTDLSKLVKQHGPLSLEHALAAIRQAALGLHHAHERGLVHRDIKPANLMLHRPSGRHESSRHESSRHAPRDESRSSADSLRAPSGQATNDVTRAPGSPHAEREGYVQPAIVKVMDFGLALLTDGNSLTELTKSGQIMGTPEYMAPEQWESTHEVDARADLYSLGATLHFLLLGRSPYRRSETTTVLHLMKSHALDPIPDLTALRSDIPPEANVLFQRLLAKSRDDRPSSALEVAQEIEAIQRSIASRHRVHPGGSRASALPASEPASSDSASPASSAPPVVQKRGNHPDEQGGGSVLEPEQSLGDLFDAIAADQRTLTLAPTRATPDAPHSRNREISDLPDAHGSLTTSATKRMTKKRLLIAATLAVVVVFAGIIIKIKHKDGTVTEIKVPDSAQVEITSTGSATDPGEPEAVRPRTDPKTTDVRGLTPPGSPKNNKSEISNANSQIPGDPDRVAAEWALSVGGSVNVIKDGITISLAIGGMLPEPPFAIDSIKIRYGPTVTDDAVAKLGLLKGLRILQLIGTPVTDAGVVHLVDLPNLRSLKLDGTRVTDACIDSITRMQKLERLYVSRTMVTPSSLRKLKALPNLRTLGVEHWSFAAEIAMPLRELPSLREIDLNDSWITEAGIAELAEMKIFQLAIKGMLHDEPIKLLNSLEGLQKLILKGATGTTPAGFRALVDQPRLTELLGEDFPFTDEHLEVISQFAQLERFLIYSYGRNFAVSDMGLEHLTRLPKLKQLMLMKTQVTPAGLARFRAAKPNCQITTDVK